MSTNAHPAPCSRCGKTVLLGDGIVNGKDADTWHVTHRDCLPVYVPRRERVRKESK